MISTPASALEAAEQVGVILAGGTALQLAWGDAAPLGPLIDVSKIAEARGVSFKSGTLRVGAFETLETCRTDHLIKHHAPLLAEACAVIAALGVRNLGTLGGNIGWRQGDTIPALLVLGAQIECNSANLPLAEALAMPALPLLLGVRITSLPAGSITIFEKIGHRAAFSPSVATVAGWMMRTPSGQISQARLAVGGAGWPGRNLPESSTLLVGADPRDFEIWSRLARCVEAELQGGTRGRIAARVLSGRLQAALDA